jgi:hypothetical protein
MKRNRLTGRRIGAAAALAAVTTFGGAALAPAAFADSTVASATTSSTAHSAVARPGTINECYQWLQAFGYQVTVARGFACAVGATAPVSEEAKLASCLSLMTVAGVSVHAATVACTAATAPG